jgi:Protein of unknown function (DUF3302)
MQSAASPRRRRYGHFVPLIAFAFLALPSSARASIFHGETLDSIANGISWVVLIIGPIIGIAIFWLVHILPEKIAHKKMHPQTRAIQCLCLLSLCFGGLLWPIASLGHHGDEVTKEQNEIEKLRARVAELEAKRSSVGAKV